MNIQEYLKRINLTPGDISLDIESLIKLQKNHYMAVPYENLDILCGTPLSLSAEEIYKKVVEMGRGGYCFELNCLYGWLLNALGFTYTERLGRFLRGETEIPMGRHRILIVKLEKTSYICDVGIGCPTPTAPVELVYDKIQDIDGTKYRLVRHEILKNVLEYNHHGVWEQYYSFGEDVNFPCDFEAPSLYCELSPHSVFNKTPMAHLFTKDGRNSLENNQVKLFRNGGVEILKIQSAKELESYLCTYFGIKNLPPKSLISIYERIAEHSSL